MAKAPGFAKALAASSRSTTGTATRSVFEPG
jgi:hypothetical protein